MIKYKNDGLPEAIYKAIVNTINQYDRVEGENVISVTELIDSPLIRHFKNAIDIEVNASDDLWKVIGSSLHSLLENSGSNLVKEMRLQAKMGKWTITGKCDVYDPINHSIEDYKFIGYSSYANYPKKEHIRQLQVLAWLFKRNKLPVRKLKVHYIWRNLTQYDLLKHDKPSKMISSYEVELWDEKKILDFISEQLQRHEKKNGCNIEERWGYIKWKVKEGDRTIRVFDTPKEAKEFVKNKDEWEIVHEIKDYIRCENYCYYKNICGIYKKKDKEMLNNKME